jgi:hypothetical protein
MKKKKTRLVFMPGTWLGKFSLGLIGGIFFLLILAVNIIILIQGSRDNNSFFDNLYISIPMFFAGISVIGAFFTGLISILKYRERAIFVFLITLFGLLALFFILGEVLVPHYPLFIIL